MKQFLITTVISIFAVSLSACTQPKEAEEVAIDMANPASAEFWTGTFQSKK